MSETALKAELEKKVAELESRVAEHKKNESLYRTLFNKSPEVIVFVDPSGKVLEVNQRVFDWIQYKPEDIIGKRFVELEFMDEDTRKLIVEKYAKRLGGEELPPYTIEVHSRDGKKHYGQVVAQQITDDQGKFLGSLTLISDITQQYEQTIELRLKNLVFESSLAANSISDINGIITHVNRSFLDHWGYDKKEDLLGKHISCLVVDKEDAAFAIDSLKIKGEWDGEFVAKRRDGSTFIAVGFATDVADTNGKVIGYQITSLDVSEQRKSEEALRDSEKRFRALFEDNIDAVFIFDLEGIQIDTNQRASELLGYSRDEIVGMHISRFTSPDEKDDSRKKLDALLRGEKLHVYERTFIKKDGSSFPADVNVSLIYDGDGNPKHFQSIVRDISVRKQARLDNEKRQKYLESFLDAIPEAIVTLDSSHKIVEWNPGAVKMFGYTPGEVVGKDIDDLITRSDSVEEANRFTGRVLSGELIRPVETIRYRKDGTPVNVMVSGSPIKLRGELQGVVAIYIDITARKQIEEELQKADKLDSLALLAGGIAHDFNNILASISVNLGLFDIYKTNKQQLSIKLKEIQTALVRAKSLTLQLLTFSKGNAPIKNPASIIELLEDTVKFALSGSNVKSEFSFAENLWDVEIDEGQVGQVIQNITINAVQAMPEGGTFQVKSENVSEEEMRNLPVHHSRYIRIELQDQGIGIPETHLKNIYDPFFTTKQKGGGLGLSTSFSIIKKHDGLITVKSEMGVGTTFYIYLPALKEKTRKSEKESDEVILGSGNILLMDDDEMVLNATSELLNYLGYNVEKVKEGKSALELYKKSLKSGTPFSCLILDLTIPDGMGGRETISELLKIDPDVIAIASSGYSVDPIISDFSSFGFSGAIAKPYAISDLSNLLNRILKK